MNLDRRLGLSAMAAAFAASGLASPGSLPPESDGKRRSTPTAAARHPEPPTHADTRQACRRLARGEAKRSQPST